MASAIAIVFGSGIQLLLSRDLVRVAMGILLVSNAANLLLMSVSLTRGVAPIHPIPGGVSVADPLVQALTLTSIVISFGTTTLLLGLLYRVHVVEHTLDTEALVAAERRALEGDGRETDR
ncbi:MAG: sodium:proton antiporter [Vicinamibacteraceae bacterium]